MEATVYHNGFIVIIVYLKIDLTFLQNHLNIDLC